MVCSMVCPHVVCRPARRSLDRPSQPISISARPSKRHPNLGSTRRQGQYARTQETRGKRRVAALARLRWSSGHRAPTPTPVAAGPDSVRRRSDLPVRPSCLLGRAASSAELPPCRPPELPPRRCSPTYRGPTPARPSCLLASPVPTPCPFVLQVRKSCSSTCATPGQFVECSWCTCATPCQCSWSICRTCYAC